MKQETLRELCKYSDLLKISNSTTNSRCFLKNNILSRVKFGESKYWKTIPNAIKNNIELSKLRTDMFKDTKLDPSEFYYVNELDNNSDCTKNGGRWIKGIENLKRTNLIPDKKIEEYNKKYFRLKNDLDNIHVQTIAKLTTEFKNICKEDFHRKELKDGSSKKEKILIELPLGQKDLLEIEQNVINIIYPLT